MLGEQITVHRNDQISIEKLLAEKPEMLVISPGPSTPDNSGICLELIAECRGKIPIFGVCLGMQCLVQASGGKITVADDIYHGKTSHITHTGSALFHDIPNPFLATRYHSLVTNPAETNLTITATNVIEQDASGLSIEYVMAVESEAEKIYGVQFHPESFMTKYGQKILANFLQIVKQGK